ncbi:MAG: VanW family protein [Chloroflexota bacterium]
MNTVRQSASLPPTLMVNDRAEAARPAADDRATRFVRRIAVVLAIVMIGAGVGLLILRTSYRDQIYPGVRVAGVELGGLSREQAIAAVAPAVHAFDAGSLTFTHQGQEWTAPYAQVGVSVNPASAVDAAMAIGRQGSVLDQLIDTVDVLRAPTDLPISVQLDPAVLESWLDMVDSQLGADPQDAFFTVVGGKVQVTPEVLGYAVDHEAVQSHVVQDLASPGSEVEDLPVIVNNPSVTATDIQPLVEQLNLALAVPVQVRGNGGIWTLPAADLGRFVVQETVMASDGTPAAALAMDLPALTEWLQKEIAPSIETEVKDAEVAWGENGLYAVTPSSDGVTVNTGELASMVASSFFGAHGVVDAPMQVVKPAVDSDNLQALGITTLLGTGTSIYAGSSDGRSHNVEVGAEILDGYLVPPRGEFSFNDAIGYITEEQGFVVAQVIAGERIGKDVGGGICQVSTTVFRAAYLAGFPITEWWPHRFRIAFYEENGWSPGLDASILQPSPDPATWDDFRFENATDHWLLVESWTDGASVVVNIYGPETGWEVVSDGPMTGEKFQVLADEEVVDAELPPGSVNQVQQAAIGEEYSFYRTVKDGNGDVLWERSFYTKFYPKCNMWKVSPDMNGLSPADPDREIPPLEGEETPGDASDDESSGGYVDPVTGEWVEPEHSSGSYGFIDPVTGIWVDASGGGFVDPSTGEWVDASGGGWVDPRTGEWVDASQGGWVDSVTGEWVQPGPGE